MARARPASPAHLIRSALCLLVVLAATPTLLAQETVPATSRKNGDAKSARGQFFAPIVEPIEGNDIQALQTAVRAYLNRAAAAGQRPVLVFEFRPGKQGPDQGRFGVASDLADYIAEDLLGSGKTVAYVPEPLSGYAVLPVLACDEIVLGTDAELGPIIPKGETAGRRERAIVESLAQLKSRDPDLLIGMLDPSLDLREVRTADGGTHFVLREHLDTFKTDHQVLEEKAAWGGRRGVLTAEHARRTIAKRLTDDKAEIAEIYNLPSTSLDPTLQATARAILMPISGPINPLNESYLLRQIARAKAEKANVILFEINSEGGLYEEANKIADAIAALEEIKTVAYIDDRAMGVSALIPLACDEIIFQQDARMGDVRHQITGSGEVEVLDDRLVDLLADRAEGLARGQGHPTAIARAMVDPDGRRPPGSRQPERCGDYVLDEQVQADPERYRIQETIKSAEGTVLDPQWPGRLEVPVWPARVVRDMDELQTVLDLPAGAIEQARRTWVDSLVDTLNERWMKGLLLFVGFFMLVLELKLPGIGLPAITAGLAFLLYFWSSYLGGTADQLEILLFLVGLICLALELFVFPGFGVFGMSGVLLVLTSVVMASHTFIWPTQEYEYRQLGWTLVQVTTVLFGGAGRGDHLRTVLPVDAAVQPPGAEAGAAWSPTSSTRRPSRSSIPSRPPLSFLLGEVGRTTTVLKPSGKARFGEMLVDVTADGFYIETDQPVEVIEVQGARVIVKRV